MSMPKENLCWQLAEFYRPKPGQVQVNLGRGEAGESEGAPQPWATDDLAEGHRGVALTAHWSAQHRTQVPKQCLVSEAMPVIGF